MVIEPRKLRQTARACSAHGRDEKCVQNFNLVNVTWEN